MSLRFLLLLLLLKLLLLLLHLPNLLLLPLLLCFPAALPLESNSCVPVVSSFLVAEIVAEIVTTVATAAAAAAATAVLLFQTLLSADLGPASLTFGVFYSSIFELVRPYLPPLTTSYTRTLLVPVCELTEVCRIML